MSDTTRTADLQRTTNAGDVGASINSHTTSTATAQLCSSNEHTPAAGQPSASTREGDIFHVESQPTDHRTTTHDADQSGRTGIPSTGTSESSRKRSYVYRTRKIGPQLGPSEKRRRFQTHGDMTEDHFKDMVCCKRRQCFKHVNLAHVVKTAKDLMAMSNAERKFALQGLLSDSSLFMFDGRPVCTEFLVQAFRFSRDLQASVKGTESSKEKRRYIRNDNVQTRTQSRDSIVVFLRRIADQTGNTMPDTQQVHLPFYDKQDVYKLFCDQYRALEQTAPPQLTYFYSVWKRYAGHIKVRTVTRFAKCTICESFKDEMQRAARTAKLVTKVQQDRQAHYDFIASERQAYKMNQDNAALNPSEYMSLAIDGADQSAFGLPHFVTVTKDTRGHSLKVKLIGILQHGTEKSVALYTMTENHETGGNHVIECIHRYLNSRNDQYGLPKVLCIQMDNCTRENKNRYTLGYLESLVLWGVFEEVYASFLPVGHTHIDIDQVFSRTATRLHAKSAITLHELHTELSLSYTPAPVVNHVNKIINFSGLLETSRCVWNGRDARIGPQSYFRFTKTTTGHQNRGRNLCFGTRCDVKAKSTDNWELLRSTPDDAQFRGFLIDKPDLRKTPSTKVRCPPNKDEVMKRLHSEEARIADRAKFASLHALVEDVYDSREDQFHWDLTNIVEFNVVRSSEVGVLEDHHGLNEGVAGQLTYCIGSFVAVRHEDATDRVPFWVGKIMDLKKNKNGEVFQVNVQWFETGLGKDVYHSAYKPTNKYPHRKGFTAWISDVEVQSIMVTFEGFTKRRQLSSEVVKQIQASVSAQVFCEPRVGEASST